MRGRYDAAVESDDLKNHWTNADGLSARAANSPEVRRKLRNRARYERDSNSYLSGISETLANDTIGTGPRLQVQLETGGRDANRRLADAFEEWTEAVCLAETLRTYREARGIDGEGFLILDTNPALRTPVKLGLRLVEADQVATPYQFLPKPNAIDGIEFDRAGNPTTYHVLREHPGDLLHWGQFGAADFVPADQVLHWFKRRRPGQCRGVPEVTPALPLFALLRRYELATVTAAEVAALFAVLLQTKLDPAEDGDQGSTITPFDMQAITRGMMIALPEGYEGSQLKPEHPATTHEMFVKVTLRGIARCLHIPFSIAAGDSADLNYSSGRLDHQIYHRMIGVDRFHLETAVLDRILFAWIAEARLAAPELVAGMEPGRLPRHRWGWDGFRHVDPEKEAHAQAMRLANGVTTMEIECAEDGHDWREVLRQRAEERAEFAAAGLPYPGDAPPPAPRPEADAEAVARAMLRPRPPSTNGHGARHAAHR